VDGFPDAASISLRQPLRVFDVGGVALEFQTNTSFGFTSSITNSKQTTVFTVAGGLRGSFDPSQLADAQTGSGFSFGTSGTFRWATDGLPQIGVNSVTFAGHMKLGGPNGFELLGVDVNGIPDLSPQSQASITLVGITNLFQLSPQHPFEAHISGALGSSDFISSGSATRNSGSMASRPNRNSPWPASVFAPARN